MKNVSERTKQVLKLRNAFFFISLACNIGTIAVLVFFALKKIGLGSVEESPDILSEAAKQTLASLSVTAIIGILGTIIIKDKIRTFLYMASVIISAIIFKDTGMYIVLAIWFLDEYVIHALYLKYKNKVEINKEIDLR